MNSSSAPLVCAGRSVGRDGQPVGERCGRRYTARPVTAPCDDLSRPAVWDPRPPTDHEQAQQARAAGWRVSDQLPDGTRDAFCGTCARPDPTLTAICRAIQKGLTE